MESDGGDTLDWAPAPEVAAELKRPSARKKSSPIPLLICVVLAAGIIGATGWFVVKQIQRPQVVIIYESKGTAASPKVFAPATAPVANAAPVDPLYDVDPKDTGASGSSSDDPDAATTDPDWTDVIVAHDMPNPGPAIIRYDDYRRRNPGKHEKTLRHFEAEAFDRMWWRRITQLCHRRVRLIVELEAKNEAIGAENDLPSKAALQLEKASIQQDQKTTENSLHNDMGFDAADAPDQTDDSAIAAARAARNKQKYADWCKDTGAYIRNHNGETPWGEEDL